MQRAIGMVEFSSIARGIYEMCIRDRPKEEAKVYQDVILSHGLNCVIGG